MWSEVVVVVGVAAAAAGVKAEQCSAATGQRVPALAVVPHAGFFA